jgi:hypothetical protein
MASPNAARAAPGVSGNGSQENDHAGERDGSLPQAQTQDSDGSRFYGPYTIKPKRVRRTKDILAQDHPQTVRQVFYALTVRGLISKVEQEYHRTVIRLLVDMREAGLIPFGWIADNTRWMRKPSTFVGLDSCLKSTAKFYRRDLWEAMPCYVEVWCEKDALAGVLMEETEVYDVPLMVARVDMHRSASCTVQPKPFRPRASQPSSTTSAISTQAGRMQLGTSRLKSTLSE